MKKILFILFTVQSVLAPHITKSYSVNSIEDSYEYSIVNQEKKTVKKDILGNTIIEAVSYTHLRAHETGRNLVCRLLLEKKKKQTKKFKIKEQKKTRI